MFQALCRNSYYSGHLWLLLALSGQVLSNGFPESVANVANWTSPSANLLGDSIYISGGDMYVGPASNPTEYALPGGVVWRLGLSSFVSLSQNLSVLNPILDNSAASLLFYVGGAMFANYDGLITYGGLQSENESTTGMNFYNFSSPPDIGLVTGDVSHPQPPVYEDPWTWYRCCGADVSAPSENLAFYFGGLTASTPRPILYTVSEGDPEQANTPSSDLIICDTSILDRPKCERLPPPAGIEPRAESELIWLPYGEQGLLLSMGGIIIPNDLGIAGLYPSYNSTNGTNNYMTSILVFDIASRTWQAQQTDRTAPQSPSQLAAFCSVVATAQDGKSHHIYIYGGYDGTYVTDTNAYDTVWVLSIPAFRWTKISDGLSSHRRQNHKCVKASPFQFFSIGGNMENGQPLNSSYIDMFDMNACMWNSSYDPTSWTEYEIPDVVQANVADVNAIPDNLEPQVKTWLSTPYSGPAVKQLGPYAEVGLVQFAKNHGASWWLATTMAVLAYLTLASFALIIVVVLRRRMAYRKAKIDTSDMTSKNKLVRWMHNAPVKMPDSMGDVKMLKSPEQYTDSITESYVDDERSEHVPASGQLKSSGTQVTTYEPLRIESLDDIELTSFTDLGQTRRL